jgi:ATP/maltotriose-dependent transcriptional regulator MalT
MGKKASLTVSKRAEIVGLLKVGLSEREIGEKVHVSKTAVPQAFSKFNISGKYTDLKRSGPLKKNHCMR